MLYSLNLLQRLEQKESFRSFFKQVPNTFIPYALNPFTYMNTHYYICNDICIYIYIYILFVRWFVCSVAPKKIKAEFKQMSDSKAPAPKKTSLMRSRRRKAPVAQVTLNSFLLCVFMLFSLCFVLIWLKLALIWWYIQESKKESNGSNVRLVFFDLLGLYITCYLISWRFTFFLTTVRLKC